MAQQNVEVRIVGKDAASREILGVGSALERMKASVETNRAGLNKLDNTLKDSAANMLGLQGSAGRLADALLEFAPGGLIGAGVVTGIALVIGSIIKQKEEQEKLREATLNYLETSNKLAQAQNLLAAGPIEGAIENIGLQQKVIATNLGLQEIKLAEINSKLEFQQDVVTVLNTDIYGIGLQWGDIYGKIFRVNKTLEEGVKLEGEINKLNTDRINLLAQAQQTVMNQFNSEVQRLGTLRELQKLGRLSADDQKELVYLTTKLTNLANNQGVDATVRLTAIKAITVENKKQVDINEEIIKQNKRIADSQKRVQDALFAIQMKRMEELQSAREFARTVVSQDLQKQLEGLGVSIEKQFEGFGIKDFETRMQSISQTAYNISDGFDVMTEAIMQGNNAFKSLEMGARAAARNILRSFAQEQIAKGIGAIGSALTATATGNFPSAGLFYQSAAKHFAAAAAAGFAGGAIGGGGSNRGGGGGGGFSNSNLGRGGAATGGPIYITISGGGILDMNNPETARAFANAIQTSTNRRTVILGR